MTDHEYMVAANLTRIRAMKDLVRMVDEIDGCMQPGDRDAMERVLGRWERRLEKELERVEEREDATVRVTWDAITGVATPKLPIWRKP